MLDTTAIEEWLALYRRAWSTDDRDDVARLFTDDVRYYTAPHHDPLRGLDAILDFWLGEQESGIPWTFEHQVVAREGDLYVVRAVTRYPEGTKDATGREEFSNLWLVTLEADGRASEFIEYFMPVE